MTSSTADHFGLRGRGRLATGAAADVVVFDPRTVGHHGTYVEPHVQPTGIRHVAVNGKLVVHEGRFTGVRAGHVLTP